MKTTSAVDGVAKSITHALGAIQDGIKAQIDRSKALCNALRRDPAMDDVKESLETNGGVHQVDEHLLKYGGRLLGGSQGDRIKQAAAAQETLVRQATVLDGCLDGGQYLPVFYMLKV